MLKTLITNSELEKWRTLRHAKSFIDDVFEKIEEDPSEIDRYIVSEGNYKQFKEEYVPIFRYLEFKYGFNNCILFRHVGLGNQEYDAEIKVMMIFRE